MASQLWVSTAFGSSKGHASAYAWTGGSPTAPNVMVCGLYKNSVAGSRSCGEAGRQTGCRDPPHRLGKAGWQVASQAYSTPRNDGKLKHIVVGLARSPP